MANKIETLKKGTDIIFPRTKVEAISDANGNTLSSIITNKQNILVNTTCTLAVADWSDNTQTVSVSGVTTTNSVIVTPAPASFADYTGATIYCSAQGSGTLTFTCTDVPTNAITINVMIVG